MIKKIEIFDLDGVLIDSLHRYKTLDCGTKIDLQYWRDNSTPEKIANDSLLPLVSHYRECIRQSDTYVIIATSRTMQHADLNYIYQNLPGFDKLIYRESEQDTRRGYHLKCKPILPMLNLKQFRNAIINIYEDNLEQLKIMARILKGNAIYIPSKQGH